MKACRSQEEAVTRRQREPRWSSSPQDEQKLGRERRQRRASGHGDSRCVRQGEERKDTVLL